MGSQVTASKTDLLFECLRPFATATVIDSRESTAAITYGNDFHSRLESRLKGETIPLDESPNPAEQHADQAFVQLSNWMRGRNPFKVEFAIESAETPIAWRPKDGVGKFRACDFDSESHHYDLRPGEIGGTADLVMIAKSGLRVVLDYKTGWHGDFHLPAQLPQLQTLAAMTGAGAVAVLEAPRGTTHVGIYADEVLPEESAKHTKRMRLRVARIDDGTLRPGEWCKYCPARLGCPSQDAELMRTSLAIARSVDANLVLDRLVDRGRLHLFISRFEALAKRAREQLTAAVAAGEIIERPDGKVLALRTVKRENLSKASIVRALGPAKGEEMLNELRANGSIEQLEYTQLVAENDR